jgi:hypothetical protein
MRGIVSLEIAVSQENNIMQARTWDRQRLVSGLSAYFLILASASTVFAQVQAGRMVGTVYDPQKAAVPGATVTVTDVSTNLSKRVVADGAGDYVVTPLERGTYSVSAQPLPASRPRFGVESNSR